MCQTLLWQSIMSKKFTLMIWPCCCFAFFKRNWSWIEMLPSLFWSDLLRNPEFAVNCYVFKDGWSNLHSNLFAFRLDQHRISKPSARPHHLRNFSHNSSIGPTPLSLHGTHTESVGSCLWLNPGLLLMGARCHCGGIKADLWAWHRVWVTNPSESVDGKDRGQIWGSRKSATSQWHTARSCARGLGMIGKQICRFRISKTVLYYLTFSVRVQKSSSSASHFTISVICGPPDFDSRWDVDSWLTVRSSDDFKCSHVLHILSSLFFMLGHMSVRKPINDSAIYFW